MTWAVWLTCTDPSIGAEITFVPGTTPPSVPVAMTSGPVVPEGWLRVLSLLVAWNVKVSPWTGSPSPSRTVTGIVELPIPA